MNLMFKKFGSNVCVFITGLVIIGAFGIIAFSSSTANAKPIEVDLPPQANSVEVDTVKTTTATQVVDIVKFKKASINEYDMSVDVKTTKKTTTKKTEEKIDSPFTVEFPESFDEVYDVYTQPLNFTATRSIANEYYTVYDIISGKTVTMSGHELICQMVNNEIGDSFGEEAIKAQVVSAYSCLRFNDEAGLTETVGLKSNYSAKLESCVNAVEGQVITYNGKIINSVYSASTAGYSTTSENIWGVSYPFLQCVKSEFDHQDPNWAIETKVSLEDVREKLEEKTGIELSDDHSKWFKITDCYSGKYIRTVLIDDQATLTGSNLCGLFDVKSTAMDISYADGYFTFTTYGWGHGVGMSQWGACLYAENGWVYDQILSHYYINTGLELSTENQNAVKRGEKLLANETVVDSVTDEEIDSAVDSSVESQSSSDDSVADYPLDESSTDSSSDSSFEILNENQEE